MEEVEKETKTATDACMTFRDRARITILVRVYKKNMTSAERTAFMEILFVYPYFQKYRFHIYGILPVWCCRNKISEIKYYTRNQQTRFSSYHHIDMFFF